MLFLNICLVFSVASVCINAIEEFSIRNPMELHDAAVKFYIKERERDPANKDMGADSPVMKRARQHAVKRFSAVPEEELTLQVISRALYAFSHNSVFCDFSESRIVWRPGRQ